MLTITKGDSNLETLFFLVSGDTPSLSFSEITSILKAEGHRYQLLKGFTQVLRIEADRSSISSVRARSSMARVCGTEVFSCKAKLEEILQNVRIGQLTRFLRDRKSFAVRIRRVRGSSPEIDGLILERQIGAAILGDLKGIRVDLKAPDKTFYGILTDGCFLFGLKEAEIKGGEFIRRKPTKVFLHSAVISAKLARCMVNLAQPRIGDLVLDPFCGTGSFLVEAGLIGCRVLGFDVIRGMVERSVKNLVFFDIKHEGVAVTDARSMPVPKGRIDCIATDPPYGTSTTTLGRGTRSVLESFLSATRDLLRKERRICIAAPKKLGIGELGEKLGLKHLESHLVYVHRNLTREIAVLER